MQYRILVIGLWTGLAVSFLGAQPLFLHNPSLEDPRPRPAKLPFGWFTCAPVSYSLPDLHPGGAFQVTTKPYHGGSYAGLVVRPDGSREGISQELVQPLDSGACYLFALHAALAPHYLSADARTGQPLDYNRPVRIQILGGKTRCGDEMVLGSSPPVVSADWTRVEFLLQPAGSCNFLRLEAVFLDPDSLPYGGHVLVDALAPLVEVSCDDPKGSAEALPLPVSLADCGRYMIRRLSPLQENARRAAFFLFPNGDWDYGNPALALLRRFLEQRPEAGPVRVGVRRKADQQMLLQAFKENDFPPGKYRIKVLPGGQCPPGWICFPE